MIYFGFVLILLGIIVLIWSVKMTKAKTLIHLNYTIPMWGGLFLLCGIYIVLRSIFDAFK